jgi:hypothetical protein
MSRPLRMEYAGALYHVTSLKRQDLTPFTFTNIRGICVLTPILLID